MKLVSRIYLFILASSAFLIAMYFDFRFTAVCFSILLFILLLSINEWLIFKIFRPIQILIDGIENIKDGDFTVFINRQGTHELNALIDVYNRILTELQTKRIQLQEMQFFFEELIQQLPFAVFLIDENKRLIFANRASENEFHFRLIDFRFKNVSELQKPFISGLMELGHESTTQMEGRLYRIYRKQYAIKGIKHEILGIRDNTKEIHDYHSETWKRMVRVISHEIQNSLSPILSINQSLYDYCSGISDFDPDFKEGIESVNRRINHLSRFVTNYAHIAKMPVAKKRTILSNEFFQSIIQLFKESKRQIYFNNSAQIQFIFVDPELFEQAIINIIKNAIDATLEGGEIHIEIRMRNRKALIQISDNGCGIAEEAKINLFLPYFSTKESGNGIGLTLVQEILHQHGFTNYIESEINKGTTFFIELS